MKKNKITGIGANVCDTLIITPSFPCEDTKQRATSIKQSGGGPCATGLVAASKLGAECEYLGTLTDDPAGKFLMADLQRYGVGTKNVVIKSGYTSFSSYILLASDTSSRTCVFHRGNIPSDGLTQEQKLAVENSAILMIDGNEMKSAWEGAQIAKKSGTKVLYDAGGLYDGVENLLPLTDILIPSEEFALSITKTKSAKDAARILYDRYSPEVVVITQGKAGGILYDGKEIFEYPAFLVDAVDSNGSGDVFHGAFAFGVTKGYHYKQCCIFSSAVSALKCTGLGARESVPSFDRVTEFLKERGINEL